MECVIDFYNWNNSWNYLLGEMPWGGWSKIDFIIKAMNIWQWWIAFMLVGFSLMLFIICETKKDRKLFFAGKQKSALQP